MPGSRSSFAATIGPIFNARQSIKLRCNDWPSRLLADVEAEWSCVTFDGGTERVQWNGKARPCFRKCWRVELGADGCSMNWRLLSRMAVNSASLSASLEVGF